ncbi:MAG TPA: PPE domain-containing protein [Pseudonocardiaceae bacterium]|nr:PPE domain-containing protein [Pseudonocardiaceae bacterium]
MAGAWDVVADVFGFGGDSGNDHGSSNWAAWEHTEIRSMLDTSVDPGDVSDAASAWRDLGRHAIDIVTGLTRDLDEIVAGGWRGSAADVAIAALGPINQWSASLAETADHTTALMDASGSSAGQAKATVPPAKPHDWGRSLRSFALGGPAGAFIDAVAQDRAQSEAHIEAVQIMNNVYSAPINDHRVAVPTYPQLADPTLQPPEQLPNVEPAPDLGQAAGGPLRNGAGGGYLPHPQPTQAGLQSVISGGHIGQVDPSGAPEPTGPRQLVGGPTTAAASAGIPIMPAISGDNSRRARRVGGPIDGAVAQSGGDRTTAGSASGAGRAIAGRHTGMGRHTGAGATGFGPRPSGAAAPVAERGAVPGRGVTSGPGGRPSLGELVPPISGRGKDGEDTEHRRPSYLIEMGDIFTDGRKVAPPVIGEDPSERAG